MSGRTRRIDPLLESLEGGPLDAHYLGFFQCFNRQLFFEAHEVLEKLWLPQRGGPNDLFYKGLIQLAGAFVHIQKQRPKPALALFKLAARNLGAYASPYEHLDLNRVQQLIGSWTAALNSEPPFADLQQIIWPKLALDLDSGIP